MKRIVLTVLLVGFIGIAKAQMPEIYTDLHVLPMKYQQYKNYVGFELDNYFLYTGEGKESLYTYIVDKNSGARLFELDQRDLKARRHKPKFYGLENDQSTTIICLSLEGDYSWGTHVIIVEDNKVHKAGFLNYGVDNFNFASIGLYAQFEKHDKSFLMFFQEDAQLINYATDDIIPGADIEFLVTKDKITRTK